MFAQVWTEKHPVILGLGLSRSVYLSPWAGIFSGVSQLFSPPYVKKKGYRGPEVWGFPSPQVQGGFSLAG